MATAPNPPPYRMRPKWATRTEGVNDPPPATAGNADLQVGTAVSGHVLNKTRDFLTTLPAELPLPVVVVESEDEVGLDWDEGAKRIVSLTIDDSDRIGFAALFGREPLYGKAEFRDGLPETVRYLLGRLYPSARLR